MSSSHRRAVACGLASTTLLFLVSLLFSRSLLPRWQRQHFLLNALSFLWATQLSTLKSLVFSILCQASKLPEMSPHPGSSVALTPVSVSGIVIGLLRFLVLLTGGEPRPETYLID